MMMMFLIAASLKILLSSLNPEYECYPVFLWPISSTVVSNQVISRVQHGGLQLSTHSVCTHWCDVCTASCLGTARHNQPHHAKGSTLIYPVHL